ncbi:hypothetical protein KFL_000040610 [Klebsormidium nitens]|uniref:Uncharacterized protein n=1 Tax=Klebsormidium nitens TaxID=105231 RepID=A0A1Y1HLL1_KLENI|nr:hypothetical protein KFL_000040610 [Klebsormidium nitens]|eukprot:GAQ77861.1 hypothetical protein KFL_000040610 [Klebsormidium nitens]
MVCTEPASGSLRDPVLYWYFRRCQQSEGDNHGSLPENLKPLSSCRTSKPAAWKPSSKKELPLTGPGKSFSGKKMQENILKDNPPQRERFRGAAPGRDLNVEKERLALIMQFKGKTPEEIAEGMKAEQFSSAATKKKVRETVREEKLETREQVVDRLLAEVEERQDFLREMRDLGRGKEYEAKMLGEIQIKMQQIDDIQRTRSGS